MVALNNLISPMYAWLYHKTGLSQYQTEGDEIWQHGILYDGAAGGAFNQIGAGNGPTAGNSGKVFSEGYYWSFDYVKWRGATTPSQTHGAVITSGAVIAQ
jgi:hypothetical protein